ncbi:unnamed protein product [Caenorhabditis auriculariae]|uniref:G-protein coupled receptors family 1 profile domain-containing protein n=1 Tax=Caenorhabditis auriculariae TaxID=2777116 RepID=A0A8S1GZC8_9PELO|nr:unnamed protein product [Caenorhabditis auriculariae]
MDVPAIFQDCTDRYNEADRIFSHCDIKGDACAMLQRYHVAQSLQLWMLAIVPLLFSSASLLLNVYSLDAYIRIYRRSDEMGKQRYILAISRAVASITSVISLFLSLSLFIFFEQMSFFAFIGTYVAMTGSLYLAVAHPFHHRSLVTLRRCYIFLMLVWSLSIINAAILGVLEATLFFPFNSPINCSYQDCELPVMIYIVISLTFSFFINCLLLLLTIFALLKRSREAIKRGDKNSQNGSAVSKLAWSLGTLTFMGISEVIISLFLTIYTGRIKEYEKTFTVCTLLNGSDDLVVVTSISSFLTVLWVTSVLADPILSILFDQQLSRHVQRQIKWLHNTIFVGHAVLTPTLATDQKI